MPVLLRFQVTNHASLRDEQELSLIAGDRHAERAEYEVPGSDLRAVPVAAIYGPNASGKSNALDALTWMRHAVLSSFRQWDPAGGVPRRPFVLRRDHTSFPSTFELDFIVGKARYAFGFTVDDERIQEEWLYSFPEGRRRKLYSRTGRDAEPMSFGRSLTGRRKTISQLLRPNSLYLSVAAAQGHDLLGSLHKWFRDGLRSASDEDFADRLDYTIDLYRSNGGESGRMLRAPLMTLLQFADLGVEDLRIREQDEGIKEEHGRVAAALREALGKRVQVGGVPRHRVQVQHRTSEGVFGLEIGEESSGTRTWIGMLGPVMAALAGGSVLCVDELDARLHPYLADALVGLFQSRETNRNGAQLVFSTHETSLLGQNARTELYRDQVWFTEKDSTTSATRLFPVTDFYVRDSESARDNLEKRYLSGRYGALPFLDDELLGRLTENILRGGKRGAGSTTGTTSR
ncbi:ATP/GTP-binding protein [Streptomyces xiamenensis]|uniref:AAA family ATPase n=1 Tax=Streptomyces xiamenensis TaxID=408015 RepID=UPI0036F0957D